MGRTLLSEALLRGGGWGVGVGFYRCHPEVGHASSPRVCCAVASCVLRCCHVCICTANGAYEVHRQSPHSLAPQMRNERAPMCAVTKPRHSPGYNDLVGERLRNITWSDTIALREVMTVG